MISIQDLGVQSYCFRHFRDNQEVARLVKECGLSKIEICGVHVDFQQPDTFEAAIAAYKDAGIDIVSVGVQGFSNNEAAERNYFEFARAAGAKFMAASFDISSTPDCYRTAEKLAGEYDIKLAIHNHGGYDWLGNSVSLAHAFSQTSEQVGLCLDTAWALDAHEDPIKMAERFADRLYGVHIKDFIFDRARKPEDVVVGTGNVDLPKLMELLQNNEATGYAVLEYEGDVENPVPALQKCVEAVHTASA